MDTIVVTMPAERRYLGVVNLVLGGLGSRLDLSFERVDDLQLAVDSVLAQGDPTVSGTLTVEVDVEPERLVVRAGPLIDGGASDDGLKRVLGTLVSSVWPLDRDGREWIQLELQRPSIAAEAR